MFDFIIKFKHLVLLALVISSASIFTLFSPSISAQEAKLIKFWSDFEPKSVMTVRHEPWQEILDTYVDDQHSSGINRFDYQAVSDSDFAKLKEYLAYLQLLEPRQLNSSEAKAYWINFYNALMVDLIIDAVRDDDIDSIRNLGGRFSRRNRVTVVMQNISIDDIHHGILRPIWNDTRVHFALATGALSGGNLQKRAYTGENVDELLQKAQNEFFNHDRAIRFEDGNVIASSIFNWYRDDFVESKSQLVPYIGQRVGETKKALLAGITRVRFDYDWTLNSPDS